MADTKTSVVIKYSRPGTAPPIYLAGSFPQSAWQPQEMEYTNISEDHYIFSKVVEVEEGKEYQYKFRIGDGDWWMSDEDAPIVTDEIGNRNNLLTVPVKSSPHTKSISNEKLPEENSTTRTISDLDTKEVTMEKSTEPAQHTESGNNTSASSHPEASILATDSASSTSSHGPEVKPDKSGVAHGTSPPEDQADHTIEPEKEDAAKELDLSSVPVEELEVSSNGIEDPEHLESHIHPEAVEESKKTTTEVPDLNPILVTQEPSEISKESHNNKADTTEPEEITTKDDEVLHTETGTNEEDKVEPHQEPVPTVLEKLDLDKKLSVSEGEKKEESDTKKDEVPRHQEESVSTLTESTKQSSPDESTTTQEDIHTVKDKALEQHEKPASIVTEEPTSKQEPQSSEGEAKEITIINTDEVLEHKEEPAHIAIEEPKSEQEIESSQVEATEETGTNKAEALELQEDAAQHASEADEESVPISTEEPHTSEANEDSVPIHTEEPQSKLQLDVGGTEAKDEPVPTHIEEPASIQESLASDDKVKEETELSVSHDTVEEEQTEKAETNTSQTSEISTSNSILADESTENLAEELEKEAPKSSEMSTSNPALPNESIESVLEEPSSTEQVVVEETDATPKEEDTVSRPVEVEEPIETTTTANESVGQEDSSSKEIDVGEIQEDDSSKLIGVDDTSAIETPADETIEASEPSHEITSINKGNPDQEIIEQSKAEEPVESTTNTSKGDEESTISSEVVSAPIVTVEKVDSEPRHGDDFGSEATFAQKEAHTLHAQDAVPDQITIRQQAATPELANVAAEVADSAALLDEAPPTPPMSDKEAGNIGYRRLSHTPIPEVADTAAEVADTAAQIDENFKPNVIELPTPHRDLSRGLDGLDRDLDIETPSEERAPLFAHESNGPPTAEEQLEYESAQIRSAIPEPMFREFDPDDPSLEPFPSNFNQILEHVRRLENQLSEDQTGVEANPISPVTMNGNHLAESVDLQTPSPQTLALESSPALLPIVEENTEGEPESKLTALPPSMEEPQSDRNLSNESKKDSGDQKTGTNDAELSDRETDSLPQLPEMKFAQSSSKLHPVLPALPLTPFVENKALNLEGSTEGSPTTEQGRSSPSITVQPATPAASVNAEVNDTVPKENAAKTTSFAEENGDSQLRARKQPASNLPDRSITPSSMRSAGNDAKSRNFLRAFFQVVFVDWIGGLIRKLCGGGRHTLLAVPALIIVVTAPILYLSGLANFGFGLTS